MKMIYVDDISKKIEDVAKIISKMPKIDLQSKWNLVGIRFPDVGCEKRDVPPSQSRNPWL